MDAQTLRRLKSLNQLALTEAEEKELMHFFEITEKDLADLNAVDTEAVERMVHVMPLTNVLREDVEIKNFTREQLQEGGPEVTDGYWQVPRLVE